MVTAQHLKYLDIQVGKLNVEESFNISKPINPHEVLYNIALKLLLSIVVATSSGGWINLVSVIRQ